jgi:hypothetical protein
VKLIDAVPLILVIALAIVIPLYTTPLPNSTEALIARHKSNEPAAVLQATGISKLSTRGLSGQQVSAIVVGAVLGCIVAVPCGFFIIHKYS